MSENTEQRKGRPIQVLTVPVEDLVSLYFEDKLPLKAVADRTGLSPHQIRSELLRAGYMLRTRSEALAIRYEQDKSKRFAVAQKIAEDRGGVCLSTEYLDAHAPMRWRCAEGHEWPAPLMNVKNSGNWCPACSGRERLTLDEMKVIATERGGRCLSREYVNNGTHLLWECSKGHQWKATPANVKRGKWCPTCSGKMALTIEEMQRAAGRKKGKCLSTTYINNQTNLLWECAKGHQWEAIPNSILRGSWCRTCAGLDKPALEELQLVAEERGGKCLSDSYKSARTKMLWECAYGHQWKAVWDRIRKGTWCPECATGVGERICRAYFSQLLGAPFPKSHPEWLRSARGTQLELDGYNEDLGIAFEHQGKQHYETVSAFDHDEKKLSHRQRLDARKRAICSERGIALVEVPGIPDILPLEEVRDYIHTELERHGREVPDDWDSRSVDLKVAYVSSRTEVQLECLRNTAIEKGGHLISERYVNDNTKLVWECAKGHRWKAIPGSIKQGTWCPDCAPNARRHLQDATKVAKDHGGKCLSQAYVNSKELLLWECAKGHQWKAPLTRILGGVWCPQCAGRGKTMEDLRTAAAMRGGTCLSEEYSGIKAKHRWQCSDGHEWEAIAESVLRGSWCPYCVGQHQTIQDMKAIAHARRGECLSEHYLANSSKLRWRCNEGHEWEAVPSSIKAGRWCPKCRSTKLTIGLMRELAASHGGLCLSSEYVNASAKLLWRCENGHEWEAAPKRIKAGRWCPICAGRRRVSGASQRT